MAERNLPIKFFQKREKDDLNTEGMGDSTLPSWALKGDELLQKSQYIKAAITEVAKKLDEKAKRKDFVPSVLKVKMNEEALAKSHRGDISNVFNTRKRNTIGLSGEDEILVKVDTVADARAMFRNLEKTEVAYPSRTAVVGVSAITNVEEYVPEIDVMETDNAVLKVKLFSYGDSQLDEALLKKFEAFCRQREFTCNRAAYSAEMNIYRVDGVTTDGLKDLGDFEGIISVTDMPFFDLKSDVIEQDEEIAIKLPKEGVNYPVVGILDTGIAKIPHLAPWIVKENITYYVEEDQDKSHGTFVSGVIVYGDELEGETLTGFDGCKLFEAIVFPDKEKVRLYESELIEHIRDAINRNDEIKIWNLSLGSEIEASLYDFSDFGKTLDEIQEQSDVLICKSTGNCERFKSAAPKSRISRSADTVRGLVVGSVGHDLLPSAFSKTGPGPSHLIKPDVVHIGGAAALDERNRVVYTPVRSFSTRGTVTSRVGTSFATPRITAIAAGLNSFLNEGFNALLLKALIVHSAKYPLEMKTDLKNKLLTSGFGLPGNVRDILYNEPNEISLILQDTIEKGHFIDILDFPFPQSMVDEDGYFYGEITVTLATTPILDSNQGGEYCQSNIEVFFGSYDDKVDRDTTKTYIKNPVGADGRKNLLSSGIYSAEAKKDHESAFASERMLVSYGDKYHPIKKWCINLDEFTPANKEKYLMSPKNWFLKLKATFRESTETKFELDKLTPSVDFCLVITIKDTKKRGNIYNEATRLLNRFGFTHNNIRIKEEVRIRLNGNG